MKPFISIAKARGRYPHGTYARYRLAKCRCELCRQALRNYENARVAAQRPPFEIRYSPSGNIWVVRNKASGEIRFRAKRKAQALKVLAWLNAHHPTSPNALIPTTAVQRHVAMLRSCGVGVRTIATCAGVARSILSRIVTGSISRTRQRTAERILAVTPDAVRAGTKMRADETFVLIERLVANGYRRRWIAEQLGCRAPALQLAAGAWITIERAAAVHALYVRLQRKDSTLPQIPAHHSIGTVAPVAARRAPAPAVATRYEHGTNACYVDKRCRCAPCIRAHVAFTKARASRPLYRYRLRCAGNAWLVYDDEQRHIVYSSSSRAAALVVRDHLNQADPNSRGFILVDVAPVRSFLQALHDNGVTDRDVGRATGVDESTVWWARAGRAKRIRKGTADRLVTFTQQTPANPNVLIDAGGAFDTLERLVAAGFRKPWIAHMLGLHVNSLAVRRDRIRLRYARALAALYVTLCERADTLRDLDALSRKRAA